jgi:LacI family transcriptional regulator
VTPGDFEQVLPRMRAWGGTGIIARIETPEVARAILDSELPTIALDLSEEQLRADDPLARLSEVASDSHGAGLLAAEHLLQRGFRHYAFVGVAARIWSQRRQQSFCDRIRRSGYEPHTFETPRSARDRVWEREEPILARWLRSLPIPIGLMACNDDRGREVLEACRTAGLRVPEEVAVVAVDNDELLCELADPPLSSVALGAEAGGYRVAALLDRLMQARRRGRNLKPRRLLVEPTHVVTRRSTDIIALDDPEVAAALHFLHDHAAEPIGVGDLVKHLLISRRGLEIRFRKVVGRTIHEELQRVRLERARRLLLETDLALSRVAEASGFASPSYLADVFRRSFDLTPARFRRQARTPVV